MTVTDKKRPKNDEEINIHLLSYKSRGSEINIPILSLHTMIIVTLWTVKILLTNWNLLSVMIYSIHFTLRQQMGLQDQDPKESCLHSYRGGD